MGLGYVYVDFGIAATDIHKYRTDIMNTQNFHQDTAFLPGCLVRRLLTDEIPFTKQETATDG